MQKKVLYVVNALVLFGVWVFASVFLSTGDEWWSMYTFNMKEMSPFNVELSWVKIVVTAFLSMLVAIALVKVTSTKKA
ncbi:hypothetical protein QWT69_04430 [Sporosarcina oncorhynchi]|uniref:Uncharacterized protein n=1 Tax=Sporosarcina oncorhynchi TaxID=3056444 RepID=A0ABZ0L9P1_9BACL|nr:hypothetical protein [Sporosarcina sp. T2O-4]WOV88377.1 hypothetical protein QWT69_04430 [Sporosarcina sp. T2O-4]